MYSRVNLNNTFSDVYWYLYFIILLTATGGIYKNATGGSGSIETHVVMSCQAIR